MATSSLDTLLKQLSKLQQGAPYDPTLAGAMQNAQYQLSDLDRGYTQGTQGIKSQYESTSRELGKQRDLNAQTTRDQMGSQGLFFSGIHAGEQGKVEEGYQRGLSNAAQRRLGQLTGLDESRRAAESGIQQMLVGAQGDYARRQSESAEAAAALKAQRESQEQMNAMMAQQNAALRALMAGAGGGGGGGGGFTFEGDPSKGWQNAGMVGDAQFRVMEPNEFDKQFAIIDNTYGREAAVKFLRENNRWGGMTPEQRAYLDLKQQAGITGSKRNQ